MLRSLVVTTTLATLALVHSTPAHTWAGPRDVRVSTGVLVVSSDSSAVVPPFPEDPGTLRCSVPLGDDPIQFFVMGAFRSDQADASAGLRAVTFGLRYDEDAVRILDHGPCGSRFLEIPAGSWPGSGSGTAVAWGDGLAGDVVPLYRFVVKAYARTEIEVVGHPTQGAMFGRGDYSMETIEGFGRIGFGMPGFNPEPTVAEVPTSAEWQPQFDGSRTRKGQARRESPPTQGSFVYDLGSSSHADTPESSIFRGSAEHVYLRAFATGSGRGGFRDSTPPDVHVRGARADVSGLSVFPDNGGTSDIWQVGYYTISLDSDQVCEVELRPASRPGGKLPVIVLE